MKKTYVFGVLTSVLFTCSASANQLENTYFQVGAAYSSFTGDVSDDVKSGYGLQGSIRYIPDSSSGSMIGGGLTAGYHKHDEINLSQLLGEVHFSFNANDSVDKLSSFYLTYGNLGFEFNGSEVDDSFWGGGLLFSGKATKQNKYPLFFDLKYLKSADSDDSNDGLFIIGVGFSF